MKKEISTIMVLLLAVFLNTSTLRTDSPAVQLTSTDPCSITINQDLAFTVPNAIYDAGFLVGQMALSVDFQFFDENNGQLLWQLGDVDTPPSSASCSISIAPDLSFSLADAV